MNTLECCMMEHYVDCPWREQALYAFDSRNQMLIGYYAYADKNAEYARANLKLIGEDPRAEGIVSGDMTPASLSLSILKYDALLSTDAEKYKDYILGEIRRNYKIMLDAGSDTVWETINGEADFNGAGSLCHGWSAVPVYIYRRLGLVSE